MLWGAPLATAIPAPRRASFRSRSRRFLCANTPTGVVVAIVCAAFAASCGTSSEVSSGPSPVKCGVRMQADSTGFSPDGGTGSLNITADRECAWSAQSDASWLSLASATGQGNTSVRFTVAKNGDPTARSARVRVQDQQVEISQRAAACDLRVSSNRESVGRDGGTRTIRVSASSAQCTWTAASGTSWITIAGGSSGQGDGAIELRIPASNGPPRTGTVTIAGKVVTVEQSAEECSVQVDPHAFTIPPAGGRGSIRVDGRQDCKWTATPDDASREWIEIAAGESNSGSGEVQFTVRPHDGPARTGHIQIANETVTISQGSNCAVAVDPAALSVGAQQTSQSIRVEGAGGCDWSAVSSAPWVTVSAGATGSGNGRVDVTIAANQGPERTATVSIGGRSVTVSQAGGCTYTVAPRSVDLPGPGGTAALTVTAAPECSWTATPNASWIVLTTGAAGSGNGRVELTATANPGPERSASISIAGQSVSVKQASGCTFTLSTQTVDLPGQGGGAAVSITTAGACPWTATSQADWVSLSAPSGTGAGQIQLVAPANPGIARSGTIRIAGHAVTVNQASPCTFRTVPQSLDYTAAGGFGAVLVIVTGSCSWTAESGAPWIRMTVGETGAGDGHTEFFVEPNTGAARSGWVTVAGLRVTVTQAAP